MKQPKRTKKSHTFSLRMPDQTRFGLELLATRERVQASTIVLKAIEELFVREGITSRDPGQLLSLLDKTYDESEPRRILKLHEVAPELLTSDQRKFVAEVESSSRDLDEGELLKLWESIDLF